MSASLPPADVDPVALVRGKNEQSEGMLDQYVNDRPYAANSLLSVMDHCLRSRDYVNVVVAGKQPSLDYLTIEEAVAHATRGIGVWEWASSDAGAEPDVVLACAGDVPTLETLAAVCDYLMEKHRIPQEELPGMLFGR